MSKLELRIPPIGVFLLFAVALWLTAASTAGHAFNDTFRFTFAALGLMKRRRLGYNRRKQ